jgi:hypothetical protein
MFVIIAGVYHCELCARSGVERDALRLTAGFTFLVELVCGFPRRV